MNIELNSVIRNELNKIYEDCLCARCLNDIKNEMNSIHANKFKSNDDLAMEEDYYINENGNWVFTAKYHLKRGYCCGNGCKHCPY